MLPENTFSSFEISLALKINKNTIQPWITRGFILPFIRSNGKKGNRNVFSVENAYQIKLFQMLCSSGFSQVTGGKTSRNLKFGILKKNKFCYMIIKRSQKSALTFGSTEIVKSNNELLNISRLTIDKENGIGTVLIIDITRMMREVDKQLRRRE